MPSLIKLIASKNRYDRQILTAHLLFKLFLNEKHIQLRGILIKVDNLLRKFCILHIKLLLFYLIKYQFLSKCWQRNSFDFNLINNLLAYEIFTTHGGQGSLNTQISSNECRFYRWSGNVRRFYAILKLRFHCI